MNVGRLKEIIKDLPDDVLIVQPSIDHSYDEPRITIGSALRHKVHGWTEDYGDEVTPEKEYGKRQVVLIVGE